MAQFAFTGDPKAPGYDPPTAEMFGKVFPFGEMVTVDEPYAASRLKTHSHFTENKADVSKATKAKQEAEDDMERKREDEILRRAEHDKLHPRSVRRPTLLIRALKAQQ